MNDTRLRVLDALADGPVSGPALAERLDVSRNAVWKHVEALREDDFEVTSGGAGYTLDAMPPLHELSLSLGLDAPFAVESHDSIDSTNRRARELAEDGAEEVVVVADAQTGARGRLDRSWEAPPGGVYLSLVVRPDVPIRDAPLFTLAAAVATARAAREQGVDAHIKWPNDVVVPRGTTASRTESDDVVAPRDETRYAKLAGILTEMQGEADRVGWLVVGIGVNAEVTAEGLPDGATSVRAETGAVDRRAFVQRLLSEFDALRADLDAVVPAWRELALTLGQRVRVETPGGEVVGEAVDVERPGTLVVRRDDGETVRVSAGDCEHLRPVSEPDE
ncbi:biotin--[acetyl-CoA-carboxylase] ligase [Halomarina oriensis]|uniref:Biotin--[acetyl-CoA-carboxylase] ligase n=1 Tax=Halomarina oriensis TaxID=671145 RepID=A0A6B0GQ71_9EURY|nr:biotin--[acetyl-CoA-carboxylase] ligase [Halomarina oriensis]MWG35739.1 biotin--[acetyl-CoA-carboxylase] ligase [Halomarina oriensis]